MSILTQHEFEERICHLRTHCNIMQLLSDYTGPIAYSQRKRLMAWALDAARPTPCLNHDCAGRNFTPLSYILTDPRFAEDVSYLVKRIKQYADMHKEFLAAKSE